jgi:hypothetical protein
LGQGSEAKDPTDVVRTAPRVVEIAKWFCAFCDIQELKELRI